MFELVIHYGGTAILTQDGQVLWTSDADEQFAQDFEEWVTIDDADEVLAYLVAAGYLPEDTDIDVIDGDEDSLNGPDGDDDDEDEDEDTLE